MRHWTRWLINSWVVSGISEPATEFTVSSHLLGVLGKKSKEDISVELMQSIREQVANRGTPERDGFPSPPPSHPDFANGNSSFCSFRRQFHSNPSKASPPSNPKEFTGCEHEKYSIADTNEGEYCSWVFNDCTIALTYMKVRPKKHQQRLTM